MLYVDNTMLSDAKTCLRYYYFRHVRGWVPQNFDAAKIFGSAWHAAMDILWTAHDPDAAYEAFLNYWRTNGGPFPILPVQERKLAPRTLAIAELTLRRYWQENRRLIESSKVIATEHLLKFPLTDEITYVGLIDKVLQEGNDICLLEHKTTAWGYIDGFNEAWVRSFDQSSQISGYLYGAKFEWPNRRVRLLVDAALVHKTARRFMMIPQRRTQLELEEWILTARAKAEEIQRQVPDRYSFLRAYPKETDSCIRFMKLCPYFSTCKAIANPETIGLPNGMIEERWTPQDGRA